MKSLYLRVWLTVVVVLGLFALGSGWLAQRHVTQERQRIVEQGGGDRIRALGELIGQALPEADAPLAEQAAALRLWSERLRMPLALDDASGQRLATSASYERRLAEGPVASPVALALDDGRTLWLMRPPRAEGRERGPRGEPSDRPPRGEGRERRGEPPPEFGGRPPSAPFWLLDSWRSGSGLLLVLAALFVAVAAGAYPVVRGLTRRLESLQAGVERFGAGALGHRVDEQGRDEVAKLAAAFNRAADRIETLVGSHTQLVANASHELRSPLARLKIALSLLEDSPAGPARQRLQAEIAHNLRELDGLIEELLLSSRLQARRGQVGADQRPRGPVDLLAVVAEEAARTGAEITHADTPALVEAEERLLRRAVRNLLENAARYGQGTVEVAVHRCGPSIELEVLDRGPGVPEAERERIFEPFYRLPGHAESEGGVGLGLALVRQIAQDHGGTVDVQAREGGGSVFSFRVPQASRAD